MKPPGLTGNFRPTDEISGGLRDDDELVARLRGAGCVFAEDEAALLREAASSDDELEALAVRRVSGEPVEHVVGWVDFGDLRLAVGPGVFVPRQRTLLLAAEAQRAAAERDAPVVVEAFCGVAPVAASVAQAVSAAQVHATDVDPRSLSYAARNLSRGSVHEGDALDGLPDSLLGRVDVIAAVPPYVPEAAAAFLPREALDHEPSGALFAGADGLDHARSLVDAATQWLRPGGVLLLELNLAQATTLTAGAGASWRSANVVVGDDGQTALARLER